MNVSTVILHQYQHVSVAAYTSFVPLCRPAILISITDFRRTFTWLCRMTAD